MSKNPFAEPGDPEPAAWDDEPTIIEGPKSRIPTPGVRNAVSSASKSAEKFPFAPRTRERAPWTEPTDENPGIENLGTGINPLAAAAAPLLQLLARLRNTARAPETADLHERTCQQLQEFEQRTRDAGVPREQIRPAHYALCASLDDVVQNTPWGSSGVWSARSLVSKFHNDTDAGQGFFVLLKKMVENPGRMLPVIELMYLCMSLGFIGRYRLSKRPGDIERVREETYAVIARHRPAANPELAPHTLGVKAPYRPVRMRVPVWVGASLGLVLVAGLFVHYSIDLNTESDELYSRLLAAPPEHMPQITRTAPVQPLPPPPPPAEPTVLDRLRSFLAPEIDQHLVSVLGTISTPIVRISNRGMFASGSATVQARFKPLLERIGAALKTEPGSVQVIGYTDNQPIRTVAFPSNFQLSTVRASAARAMLVATIDDPARVSAEGRAEADPIADNSTPDGRELNRRIEVVLHRQSP